MLENIIVILVGLVAVPVAVVCSVDAVSGGANGSTWFLLLWSVLWLAVLLARVSAQGRSMHQVRRLTDEQLGTVTLRWNVLRPS